VKSVLGAVDFEPLEILVDRIGRFRRSGGDIWWAGLRGNDRLSALQAELTEKLIAAGFAPDRREYNPHITLGREVVTREKPWAIKPLGEKVSGIDLMKSERIGGKLTYTSIFWRRGVF